MGSALPNLTCPVCGAPNECAAAQSGSFDKPCWCASVTISAATLARIPDEQRNRACLCPNCAAGAQS